MAIAGRLSTPFTLVISAIRSTRIPRSTPTYLLNGRLLQLRSFRSSPPSSSSKPRVSYRIAGSCSAKGHRFNGEKNTHNFDPAVQTAIGVASGAKDHATKRRKARPESGEDAFFASQVGSTNSGAVAFAVADGVGGWAESKVDPADFSHGLCNSMAQAALSWDAPERLRAKHLLQMGYNGVVADESVRAGGSTACVGVAQSDGTVELANLGDSGSVLLRLAAVHHYSPPQTHAFNTPYQLSIIPPRMRAQAAIFGGVYFEDLPRDAAVSNIVMQHGDVLVLATDGVFDNLNNQDILKIVAGRMVIANAWTGTPTGGIGVSSRLDELTRPGGLEFSPSPSSSSVSTASSAQSRLTLQGLLAASIAGEAKFASIDVRRDGPFAKEAQRNHPGEWFRGGKVDDICVLVIIAVEG